MTHILVTMLHLMEFTVQNIILCKFKKKIKWLMAMIAAWCTVHISISSGEYNLVVECNSDSNIDWNVLEQVAFGWGGWMS